MKLLQCLKRIYKAEKRSTWTTLEHSWNTSLGESRVELLESGAIFTYVTETAQASAGSSGPSRTIDIRVRAFDQILQLLNLATQLGVGPKLNDLAKNNDRQPAVVIERQLKSPVEPLGGLRRVKTKSVGIQTNISNRHPPPSHHSAEVSSAHRRNPSLVST